MSSYYEFKYPRFFENVAVASYEQSTKKRVGIADKCDVDVRLLGSVWEGNRQDFYLNHSDEDRNLAAGSLNKHFNNMTLSEQIDTMKEKFPEVKYFCMTTPSDPILLSDEVFYFDDTRVSAMKYLLKRGYYDIHDTEGEFRRVAKELADKYCGLIIYEPCSQHSLREIKIYDVADDCINALQNKHFAQYFTISKTGRVRVKNDTTARNAVFNSGRYYIPEEVFNEVCDNIASLAVRDGSILKRKPKRKFLQRRAYMAYYNGELYSYNSKILVDVLAKQINTKAAVEKGYVDVSHSFAWQLRNIVESCTPCDCVYAGAHELNDILNTRCDVKLGREVVRLLTKEAGSNVSLKELEDACEEIKNSGTAKYNKIYSACLKSDSDLDKQIVSLVESNIDKITEAAEKCSFEVKRYGKSLCFELKQ